MLATQTAPTFLPEFSVRLVRERKRRYSAELTASDAPAAVRAARAILNDSPVERVVVLYLNGRNQVTGAEVVSQGGLHGAAITPADVFRGAIVGLASAIVVAHNHPSGDPQPSREDLVMTAQLMKAGKLLGIEVMDHLTITPAGWGSCYEALAAMGAA